MEEIYRDYTVMHMMLMAITATPICVCCLILFPVFIFRFFKRRIRGTYKRKNAVIQAFKYMGVGCLIVISIIAGFILAWGVPSIFVLIEFIWVTIIILKLLKKKGVIYYIATISIFATIGLWLVFNNNLPGPVAMESSCRHEYMLWFCEYRFYWIGQIVQLTLIYATPIAVLLLIMPNAIKKIKTKANKQDNNEK